MGAATLLCCGLLGAAVLRSKAGSCCFAAAARLRRRPETLLVCLKGQSDARISRACQACACLHWLFVRPLSTAARAYALSTAIQEV